MKKLNNKYCFLMTLLLLTGCVEPFSPSIDSYDDLLVVDAMISEDPGSHRIVLTRSFPLNLDRFNAESGAIVEIRDSNGSVFRFSEFTSSGIYTPLGGSFQPVPGEIYTLSIITQNGNTYESDPVTMIETAPIEELSFIQKSIPSDAVGDLDNGFEIIVNTGTGGNEPGYYKFDWEETYQIVSPFESYLIYDPNSGGVFLREEAINNCWIESTSSDINLASSENLSMDIIAEQPIRFVSFREPKLRVKYSILVKQYALSEQAFRFWNNLKESNESTGTLYDSQPFQVTGNIRNINNESEPVLGYFHMSTVSSKRLFITNRSDVPQGIQIPSAFPGCLNGADTTVNFDQIPYFTGIGYLISYYNFGVGYVMALKTCVDCQLKGSPVKPEFWDQ